MADGTVLNGVYARRIHKSNAQQVVEDATDEIRLCRENLMIGPERHSETLSHVTDNLEGIEGACIRRFFAQYIIDNPDEVEDELEGLSK